MQTYLGSWTQPDDPEPVLFRVQAESYDDAERRINLALADALRDLAECAEWDVSDLEEGDSLESHDAQEVFGRVYIGRMDAGPDVSDYQPTSGCREATLYWPGLEAPVDG